MKKLRTYAALACIGAFLTVIAADAQVVRDTAPARAAEAEKFRKEVHEEEVEQLFIMNRIPPLKSLNSFLNMVDEKCPAHFVIKSAFLSDWLDEGANAAKKGLQIQQIYAAEFVHEFGPVAAGVSFEYFQIDTTGAVEGPSTLERDFSVYAPLRWGRFSVSPVWTYVKIDGGDDSGEIGCAFSIDMPLNPTFAWNYDYDDVKGNWFEWALSQDFDIPYKGEKLATFTPSVTLGMDNRKAFDHTGLANIDFGLDLEIPVMERFAVVGLLHFSKSLNNARDEDGARIFEDIIPWGGLALVAEF